MKLNQAAIEYCRTRGLSVGTLLKMRVTGGDGAIILNYLNENNDIVNWKSRSYEGKSFMQMKGGVQIAYNWGNFAAGSMDVAYITEGEIDAISLVEAGIPADQVLCGPTGAPSEPGQGGKRYQWLYDALDKGLNKTLKYVIAVDNDEPGRALRLDLVHILGAAKTWFVDWPDGIKDANDMLLHGGLREYVHKSAKLWPAPGLHRLSEMPEPPELELWEIGFADIGKRVRFAPTMVSAVTGFPGSGKSVFFEQVWFQIARNYGIKVAIFSAETRVKPHVRRVFRQTYHGMREWDQSPDMRREADRFIDDNFVFMEHQKQRPTMQWLMDAIEVAIIRHGCRAVMIDPWNKIEPDFDRRQQTETEWIGECLDRFIEMARALNVHIQIIAHPAKPENQFKKSPPDLYSISGSAHWNNRVDQGFAMWREKIVEGGVRQTAAELHCLKTRFEELGYPAVYTMNMNLDLGIFECVERVTMQPKLVAASSDSGW